MNKDYIKEIFENKNKIKELEKRASVGSSYKRKYELLSNNYESRVEKAVDIKSRILTDDYQKEIKQLNKDKTELNQQLIKYDADKRKLIKKIVKQEKELEEKDKEIEEKNKKIEELEREISKLNGKLNLDSNNSGKPTSQTPLDKEKRNPNTRKPTDKHIGGQIGHPKSKLEIPTIITEEKEETLEKCTSCNSEELIDTGKVISKYTIDYKIIVSNTKHNFKVYKCSCCGKEVHKKIPNNLKEEVQYGPKVKAQMLTLSNVGNVPINKIRRIISGLSLNINPSEGYISKLQTQASKNLDKFIGDLKDKIIKSSLVYWDDTVIFVNTKRNCLRFYGDDKLAFYVAHETKGKKGLDEDKILNLVDKDTCVVHDHNIINYNKDYDFKNVECCIHLLRDLEKVSQSIPNRTWAKKIKEAFSSFNEKRNELIKNKIEKFNEEELNDFIIEFDENIALGYQENAKDSKVYYSKEELALLNRLVDYRDNYLYWLYDFNLPFTNNLSERSLRGAKSKMKVSGQFQNIARANDYAKIRSYIETAHRNNINESYALERLADGNPLTLEEMLNNKND